MEDKKKNSLKSVSVGLAILAFLLSMALIIESIFILTSGSVAFPFNDIAPVPSNKVAVIYVEGTIVTDNIPSGYGYASSNDVIKSLRQAQNDKSIKAIVLRINSPGGTPVAAEEIHSQIEKTRAVKPVVVSMGDMATSAAYFISAPCNKIVANPDTFTGSIGVIWVFENRTAYYGKEGVEYYVAKTGPYKDVGADWRGLSDSEKTYVNDIINESYSRFVDVVSEGRNIPREDVVKIADGRVFTGQKAKQMGLVDEMGGMYDAIDIAAKLGNISGTPDVTYMNEPSLYSLLFGSESSTNAPETYSGLRLSPALEYKGPYQSPYGRLIM